MVIVIQANGAALQSSSTTLSDFQTAMVTAAPSPWITFTDDVLGSIYLNTFTIAYYYGS